MSGIKSVPAKYTTSRLSTKQIQNEDPVYEEIVKMDTSAIPGLIKVLSDTTLTSIQDSCNGGFFTYSQLAFLLIHDIEPVPYFSVTKIQFDVYGNCGSIPENFLNYIKKDPADFQKKYLVYFNSKERKSSLRNKSR